MKTVILSFYVPAILCIQGFPTQSGLAAKRDVLQQETTGNDLFQKDIDQQVVSTVERALDTLNEFFEKRHHHKTTIKTTTTTRERRTLIDDIWTNIKTGATELWKNNKEDILKTGLALFLGKRGGDDAERVQRSSPEHRVELLKRASGNNRAFFILVRRGWWSDAWNTVKNAAGSIGNTIKDGYNKLKDKIEDKIEDAKEKLKELVARDASHSSVKFSKFGNYLDKRAPADRSAYQDYERRSYAEEELERRDDRTDNSLDFRRALEAVRDLQDFLDLAAEFAV